MAPISKEASQLWENTKRDLKQLYEKVKQYPLISLFFIIAVFLLIAIPHWQVSGIKVALAHPAASNGVCSRHRPKLRKRKQ